MLRSNKMKTKKIMNLVYIVVAITSVILQWTCNAADLTFDVKANTATIQSYSTLLNNFRDRVKDPRLTGTYGFQNNLPVVAAPTKPAKYLYIDIQADNGKITAAFDRNDLYYVGYAHTADGTKKVRLLKDAPTDVKLIFPDVTNKNNRYYSSITGNYRDLGDRASVGLGAKPLNTFINDEIYKNKKFDITIDQKLALMVIQTIAEATRFKYIEGEIVHTFNNNNGFKANAKAIALENNWEKTSKTVKESTGPRIDLELKDKNGNVVWKWFQVGELVDVIGILIHLK